MMKTVLLVLLPAALAGCTLLSDAHRVGCDFDLGVGGGVLANVIGDVHLKTTVAIERAGDEKDPGGAAGGGDRGFL